MAQHLCFPIGLGEEGLGRVAKLVAVRCGNAVALKTQESPGNLQKPTVLNGVVEALHMAQDGADAFARVLMGPGADGGPARAEREESSRARDVVAVPRRAGELLRRHVALPNGVADAERDEVAVSGRVPDD